jgi:hypothetical protein
MTSLLVEALLRSSVSDLEASMDEALLELAFEDDDDGGAEPAVEGVGLSRMTPE